MEVDCSRCPFCTHIHKGHLKGRIIPEHSGDAPLESLAGYFYVLQLAIHINIMPEMNVARLVKLGYPDTEVGEMTPGSAIARPGRV